MSFSASQNVQLSLIHPVGVNRSSQFVNGRQRLIGITGDGTLVAGGFIWRDGESVRVTSPMIGETMGWWGFTKHMANPFK
jgi:hypothetical protein